MKWGVRKAVENAYSGRSHSLSFGRIRRKLALIQENKMINKVQKAKAQGKNRKVKRLYNKANETYQELKNNANLDYQRGQNSQMKEDQSRLFWWSDAAGRFGSSPKANTTVRIMNRIDGRKSRKLMSDKGHAAAIQKRNAYANQMSRAFAGTGYANSFRISKKTS